MKFKGWKKTGEDHHSASFEHENGSKLKIAKSSLSKKHLGELGRLPLHKAGGGPVEDVAPDQESQVVAREIADDSEQQNPMPQPMGQPPGPTPTAPQPQTAEQVANAHAQDANNEAALSWQDRANGYIKPETQRSLFHKQDTLGKIGTLFGLMVSGAGAGLSHQPNALLEMMNKELERDLEAQKTNVTNSQNYWKVHQANELNKAQVKKTGAETMGTLVDNKLKANTLAKNEMMLSATHKILNDINALPNGPQKTQALQKFNELQSSVDGKIKENNAQMGHAIANDPEGSFQKSQQGLRTAGNLGILPGAESIAHANDERHLPGFGDFSTPVPQDVKQELIAKQEYDKAARKYIEFAQKHQGNWANLNPKQRMEIARRGAVLGAELQGKYRLKTKGGVYKEGEQKYIESIIPSNAASWEASFNQIPKVEQTIQDNTADTQNLAKGYGGEAPKYYKGKYYMRGKNGEAVEVK